MKLFSRVRREVGFVHFHNIGREYGPGALAATHTVSSLCVHFELPAATPEVILLALRQDHAVRRGWELSSEVDEEIEAEALARKEKSPDLDGWSRRGIGVINTAWNRADRRGSKLATRGDLLSGLAGASGLPGRLLREAELDLAAFDAEEPPVEPDSLAPPSEPADDTPVWVVCINDKKTQMSLVTEILRESFGCTQPRAVHLMYTTHFFGSALVAELPFGEANRRVERAAKTAEGQGAPFELRILALPA